MLSNYLLLTLEFICYYYVAKKLIGEKIIPQKNDIIFWLSNLLLLGCIPSNCIILLVILGQFFFFLYSVFLCHRNILNGFILYELTMVFLIFSQLFLVFFFTALKLPMQGKYVGVIGNVLTLVFMVIILVLPFTKKLYFHIIKSSFPYRLLFLNTFSLLLAFIGIGKMKSEILTASPIFVIFFLLFLIAANACILFYDARLNLQQHELISYKKNLPIYEALINEIRANQHEYSNHIQALQNLPCFFTNYKDLSNALRKNTTEYIKPLLAYPLLQINMPLLAAALYHQFKIAENQQIYIQFDVVSEELKSSITESLLTDLCCILTQNAIEACTKNDNIYIRLSSDGKHTQFEIRNPVPKHYTNDEIHCFFQQKYTTKNKPSDGEKLHGYGLYYLQSIIIKYKGCVGTDCIQHDSQYWILFRINI